MRNKINTGMTPEDKALISAKLSDRVSVLSSRFPEGAIQVSDTYSNRRNPVALRATSSRPNFAYFIPYLQTPW